MVDDPQAAERAWLLQTAEAYAAQWRAAEARTSEYLRHEDRINAWAVTLCGGAVGIIPAIAGSELLVGRLPSLDRLLVFVPFVVGVIVGMRRRLLLSETLLAFQLWAYKRQVELWSFTLRGSASTAELRADLFEIIKSKPMKGRAEPGPGTELAVMESTYRGLEDRQVRTRAWPYRALWLGVLNLALLLAGWRWARIADYVAQVWRR